MVAAQIHLRTAVNTQPLYMLKIQEQFLNPWEELNADKIFGNTNGLQFFIIED